MNIIKFFTLFFVTIIVGNLHAQEGVEKKKDYELLGKLPDFAVNIYKELEFDSYEFYDGKEKVIVEGKKIEIDYWHKDSKSKATIAFPSKLQILRNYSNAIKKAGGEIVFERSNSEYGIYRFMVAGSKEIWVKVRPRTSGKNYSLVIVEREEMVQELVINAELIKSNIDIQGRIAIYGILFDVGKSIVKQESKDAMTQIAEYLKENPSVACWIVGHTDADGSFEVNSKLSLDRAKAVKTYLETNFNIAASRLFAEGVGPLAPVASNATEEGKALNRRVELVKK